MSARTVDAHPRSAGSGRRGARRIAAAAGLALLFAGCGGGPPADLFTVARSGEIPGARLELRITDDGRVSCNGGELVQIPSADTITARQARRDLEGEDPEDVGPADENMSLPPGPGSILRYVVRAEAGTVSFSDTSRDQPQVFRDVAALTRRLAKGPCGLPR